MKTLFNVLVVPVLLVSLLVSSAPPAAANPQGLPELWQPGVEQSTRATGVPDEFGYTWDDGEVFAWIDAKTDGTDLELSGSGGVSNPVNIGFDFPFYENTYTQVYVTTSGWLTFDPLPPSFWQYFSKGLLLQPTVPNNVIAPYWDYLFVGGSYNEGAVYAKAGGTAPNRYFVVEWHGLTDWSSRNYTFQVILHEGGDIVMQYLTIIVNTSYPGIVGIEDSRGVYRLEYTKAVTITNEKAIRFTPPEDARRVLLTPFTYSAFANPGPHDFTFSVHNTGTLGDDTYNLAYEGDWVFAVFEEDAETPITNPFTLAQGAKKTIVGRVAVPPGTQVADYEEIILSVTSTNDPSITKAAVMAFLTPAPFAQSLFDGADEAYSNFLVTPEGQEKTIA